MVKKTGLGKGLDALFGPTPEEEKAKETDIIKNLSITEIEPNRDQPRKDFNQESLEQLADSIKEYGLIQPIVVTQKEGYYSIIAGERRWRACKIAGLTEIPAIIRDDDEKKNKEISLIENIQREDLNPYEKATAIKALIDDYGMTHEELAKKLGKSRSSISNTIRLLNLDPRVMELAKQGKLSETHCRGLLAITDPDKQYLMALEIIKRGVPTSQLEQTNKKINKKKISKDEFQRISVLYKDIENSFQGFFGTKVKIAPGKKKGKIIIEYSSNDDLERILGLMK